MVFYDGFGNIVDSGSVKNTSNIYTDAYENNLKNVFSEDFKQNNSKFLYTNCSASDSGLSCSGFCMAKYDANIPWDYCKAVMEFDYTEDTVIGIFLTGTLGYVDTADLSLNLTSGYTQQDGTLSSSNAKTGDITFTFVSGNKYALSIERKSRHVILSIKDISSATEVSISAYIGQQHSANVTSYKMKSVGIAVFSGDSVVTGLSFYVPFYGQHLKCLIIGDSITEGVGLADSEIQSRYAWKMLEDYLHYDGIICGVGGAVIDAGITRIHEIIDNMGYTFDNIFIYLGTNNSLPTEGLIDTYAKTYQGYVDALREYGSKILWAIPVHNDNGHDWLVQAILKVTGVEFVRFDSVLGSDYDTHPNVEGHNLMYECAKTALEIIGA